ncbi:MAG: sortase, partial [Actinobacteria bacterium]|nr:sortase [Actinomycetota bacterium]
PHRGALRLALAPAKPVWRPGLPRLITSTALLTLGMTLLGFAAWFMGGSQLHYFRVQHDAYANFRPELEQGAAPVGPTDPTDDKKLLAPGTPVAILSIPEVRLSAVVLEGTSGDVLEGGPGHLRDTPLPGQLGVSEILGRRAAYGGPFARLLSLSPGARFTVTTGQGVSRYKVLDIRRAGDRIPPFLPGQGRLILATADGPPFAPTGVVRIDAQLVSKPQPAPPMVLSSADIGPAEQAFGTEPIAWVPLVLWGQGLVLAALGLSWARSLWSRWQTWIVAVPVLGYLGLELADQVARLLPNLM